jgi:hypothetical protein
LFEIELIEYLDGQGYALIEAIDEQNDDDLYLLIRHKTLMHTVQKSLTRADIEEYFAGRAADLDDDIESVTDER